MFDLIREILQTLQNNKLRTALTGLSVAWGIFMLIILLGMSRGVYNSFNSGFRAQGANSIQMWGGRTSMPYQGYKNGRSIELRDDDPSVIDAAHNKHIGKVLPLINGKTTTVSTSKDYVTANCLGVTPEYITTQRNEMAAGRFINAADIKDKRKVIVLSSKNVGQLFESAQDALGKYVNMGGLSFKVIGVYESEWSQELYAPYTTIKAMNGDSPYLESLTVEVENLKTLEQGEKLEEDVRGILARKHEFAQDDKSALWIWNRFTNHLQMANGLNILNIAVWVIGIFTMLSGIIGVSNIMFVSVKERTHEIGIRRAIGAKPRSILTQIITESIAITALFGYIGVVLGIGVTELLNYLFGKSDFLKDPTVDVSIALQVTLVLIVAGSLAGLFPALKALKVKPVEALRTE